MPYEIYKEVKPNISHLHVLGGKYFVINNRKDNFGKFDAKVDESIFNVYSNSRQCFWISNKKTLNMVESVHISFDETNSKKIVEVEVIDYACILGKNIL